MAHWKLDFLIKLLKDRKKKDHIPTGIQYDLLICKVFMSPFHDLDIRIHIINSKGDIGTFTSNQQS